MEWKKRYEKAKHLAEKAHKGRTRKMGNDKGKPYHIHPHRMADQALKDFGKLVDLSLDFDKVSPAKVYIYILAYAVATICEVHDIAEDEKDKGYSIEKIVKKLKLDDRCEAALKFVTKQDNEEYFDFIMRNLKGGNIVSMLVKRYDLDDNRHDLKPGSMKAKYDFAYFMLDRAITEYNPQLNFTGYR